MKQFPLSTMSFVRPSIFLPTFVWPTFPRPYIVLQNCFAKQVYDTKKREELHAACKNVSYNPIFVLLLFSILNVSCLDATLYINRGPKRDSIHRDRVKSVIRPALYHQATTAGYEHIYYSIFPKYGIYFLNWKSNETWTL